MRKILSLAIAVLMLFVLVACNSGLQNKIDELQAKLQEQTDKISQLEQAIEDLEQTLDQENGDTISYNVALWDMDIGGGDEYNIFRLIGTLAEWEEVVANHPSWDRGYDQEFFEQKALIVCVQRISNMGYFEQRIEVSVDNGAAIVRLIAGNDGTLFDALSNWVLVVEVNKSDFAEVSDIVIETNFGYNDSIEI